jgi:hypothetical protein
VANVYDPWRSPARGSADPADTDSGWRGWLITALLVFIGVSLAGVVASVFHPRPQPTVAAVEGKTETAETPPSQSHGAPVGGSQPAGTEAKEKAKEKEKKPLPLPASAQRPGGTGPAGKTLPAAPTRRPQPAATAMADKALPAASSRPAPPAGTAVASSPAPGPQPGVTAATANVAPDKGKQKEEPKPAPPPEDATKRAAYAKAVGQTRLAFWQRDLTAAHRYMKTARKNAQTPDDAAESARLETILDHLDQFWNAVRDEVAKLTPGDELELKDNRVAVVEASRTELMIHIYGRQRRYRIEALPIALIRTLVDRSFTPTPGSKVIVGTFLAMDKEGDRARARVLWEDAAKHGESLGHDLLPELDVPLPGARGR